MGARVGIWSSFQGLIPYSPLLIGEITAHNADGTSSVTLPGGGVILAKGQSVAIGTNAFIRDGQVQEGAPTLPSDSVEV